KAEAPLAIGRLASSVARVLIAAVIMGVVVWWSYPYIEGMLPRPGTLAELGRVLVAVVEGAVVYIFGLWVLRVPELEVALGIIRRARVF
ncbi:MAG: hypothetical protein GX977_05270, partial [Firmicutes bacterium]|nr:hypothetical protein [Bacillota bacterium]